MDPTQRSITSSPRDHDAKKRLTILHFRKHLAPMKTMNHLPLDDTGIWLTRVNCDNNDSLYIRRPRPTARGSASGQRGCNNTNTNTNTNNNNNKNNNNNNTFRGMVFSAREEVIFSKLFYCRTRRQQKLSKNVVFLEIQMIR